MKLQQDLREFIELLNSHAVEVIVVADKALSGIPTNLLVSSEGKAFAADGLVGRYAPWRPTVNANKLVGRR